MALEITPETLHDYNTMDIPSFLRKYKTNFYTMKKIMNWIERNYIPKKSAQEINNDNIIAKYWKENIIKMAQEIWPYKTCKEIWLKPYQYYKRVLGIKYHSQDNSVYDIIKQKRLWTYTTWMARW